MYRNYLRHRTVHHSPILLALLVFQLFAFSMSAQAAPVSQNAGATAKVVVSALNVRSGPGTTYSRLGVVKNGETLTVLGQSGNCAWLQIRTAQKLDGWVSGAARYVTLSQKCAEIPATTATSSASQTNPAQSTTGMSAPTATPIPTPTSVSDRPAWLAPGVEVGMAAELEQKVPLKADQACVLFVNTMIVTPILITFTHQEMQFNTEIPVEGSSEKVVCLPAGKYTFTISAPFGDRGEASMTNVIRFYAGTRDLFRVYKG